MFQVFLAETKQKPLSTYCYWMLRGGAGSWGASRLLRSSVWCWFFCFVGFFVFNEWGNIDRTHKQEMRQRQLKRKLKVSGMPTFQVLTLPSSIPLVGEEPLELLFNTGVEPDPGSGQGKEPIQSCALWEGAFTNPAHFLHKVRACGHSGALTRGRGFPRHLRWPPRTRERPIHWSLKNK